MSDQNTSKGPTPEPSGSPLSLTDLILQIRREIIETQKKIEGEPAMFEMERMELEVKVATTASGGGKLGFKFYVVNLSDIGGTISKENVHTIKLTFRPSTPTGRIVVAAVPEVTGDEEQQIKLKRVRTPEYESYKYITVFPTVKVGGTHLEPLCSVNIGLPNKDKVKDFMKLLTEVQTLRSLAPYMQFTGSPDVLGMDDLFDLGK